MIDFIPSVKDQAHELLDLMHFMTISEIISAKIIIAKAITKVNNFSAKYSKNHQQVTPEINTTTDSAGK
jgi:hypothetical protein